MKRKLQDEVGRIGGVPLVPPAAGSDFSATAATLVVALLSGRRLLPLPSSAAALRLAAGGVLTPERADGKLAVWGSAAAHPLQAERVDVCASRGPLTRAVLGGPDVYGDPAWLLPWFYRPDVAKRWELGLVLPPGQRPPAGLPHWVRVIASDAPDDIAGLEGPLESMLACGRIASAVAGALALAETYGIPCLPIIPAPGGAGLKRVAATQETLGFAMADLYGGLRRTSMPAYLHPPGTLPDPERLVAAIDQAWSPAWLREDDLIDAFPLPCAPVPRGPDSDVFHHPLLAASAAPPDLHAPRTPPSQPVASALQDWVDEHAVVPLAWAKTSDRAPFPNLGDALSAVIVSVMTGLRIEGRNFDDRGERLVAVGTIAHAQRNGIVHLWGTGLDPKRNAFDPTLRCFALPPDTRFVVHAMRGRYSAARLSEAGIACAEAFGDPVWFLPRLVRTRPVTPRWELGVVLHLTEMAAPAPDAPVLEEFVRYRIPPSLAGAVRLICTYTEQGTEALLAKVDEMRACKRIVSTSFHGLVIPESFGIPNMWFSPYPGDGMMADVDDPEVKLDHRVRDWYSGMGRRRVPIFGAQRHLPTRWDQVIRWIDAAWEPARPDAAALFEAFPLRKAVAFDAEDWPLDPILFADARY